MGMQNSAFGGSEQVVSTSPHRNNFDFVRLCAALCVVVSHQFALNGLPEPVILNTHSLGGLGVLIFFSVSGYLVAQSWDSDPQLGRFAARRLLRIWPGLAGVTLIGVLLWAPLVSSLPLKEYFHHPGVHAYLNNLRFSIRDGLPVSFTGSALPFAFNGPLWTIPLELKCYVVLALCGAIGLLRSKWPLLVVTAAILVRYGIVEPRGDGLVNSLGWELNDRWLLEFGLFFAAGVLLHYVDFTRRRIVLALVAAGWAAAFVSVLSARLFLALWFLVPVAVIAIGTASTPFIRRAGRFGDLSYGIYIYAFPVQQTLIWLLGKQLSWGALFAVTLVSTGALAFMSWHLIEKRALRLKPKRRQNARADAQLEPKRIPS
jgi:peptidoglycan/LPS O-acetylase OafA/YrhL